MCDCADLIGMRYRLGADGNHREIDCIHMVYRVLQCHQIPAPRFNLKWYTASPRTIARDLLQWGQRIDRPAYDGDVLLMRQDTTAFAVTWQRGILYINRQAEVVSWCSLEVASNYHCFRSRSN